MTKCNIVSIQFKVILLFEVGLLFILPNLPVFSFGDKLLAIKKDSSLPTPLFKSSTAPAPPS